MAEFSVDAVLWVCLGVMVGYRPPAVAVVVGRQPQGQTSTVWSQQPIPATGMEDVTLVVWKESEQAREAEKPAQLLEVEFGTWMFRGSFMD